MNTQEISQDKEQSVAPAKEGERKDVIDVGGILRNYLKHWWVFLLCLAVCVGAAVFYMKKKSPIYSVVGMIMLNQQEGGGMPQIGMAASMMSAMGLGSTGSTNPENEVMKMTSHTMKANMVHDLGLQSSYWENNGFFKRRMNYYHDQPVNVTLPQAILDTISVASRVQLEGPAKGPWHLTIKQKKTVAVDTEVKSLPYNAKTPYGTYTLTATENFPQTGELNMCVQISPLAETIEYIGEHLGGNYITNKADAIEISMEDACIPRGEAIVNYVMDTYNQERDDDTRAYNKEVLEFIDNRLLSLYHELESSEGKIEDFRKQHKVVSAEAEAEYIFTRKGALDQSSVELLASIKVMEMIQQTLTSQDTKYSLIPFSGGGGLGLSEAYFKLIESYNELILQRMNLVSSAKAGHPALVKLDEQIEALRGNILQSVDRELKGARLNLATLEAEQSKGNERMNEIPYMEHELITLYRDREVQNAIYAFLLQKREETQIALSQTQPVGKIIDRAYPLLKPISPKGMIIYGAAVLFGLGVPAVWLQMRRRRRENEK